MANASLVVVGSGIKLISHLTPEAKAYIEQADKVLYLVNEPIIKQWLHTCNGNAESLDHIYSMHESRLQSYSAITAYILAALEMNQHVCVVVYGHPTVFAKPALDAVIKAREMNYDAIILPGISSKDCLFADLLIDPASHGCLSYDATDLLLHRRQVDVSCHLILWQVGVIGVLNHVKNHDNKHGLVILHRYLSDFYQQSHVLVSYSAAQYPSFKPIIKSFPLNELPMNVLTLTRIATLYVAPAAQPVPDADMLIELNITNKNNYYENI